MVLKRLKRQLENLGDQGPISEDVMENVLKFVKTTTFNLQV